MLEEAFEPRKVTPSRFPAERFDIAVRFDHSVVRWVRERQHFTFIEEQTATEKGIVMTYRVANWGVIATWLLGWGDNMEIITPHALRENVAETARRMITKHAG